MKRRSPFPLYVHHYRDRHGTPRSAFRRRSVRVPLPLPLLGPEWWEAYRTAFADYEAGRRPTPSVIGAERTKPGTVAAAFVTYTGSTSFRNKLAASTQRWHINILRHWRDDWADRRLAHLERRHVQQTVGHYASPVQAKKFLKALRRMLRYSISIGLIEHDPSDGIEVPRHQEINYRPWTAEEIARYRRRHPLGSTARMALELGLGTAQRPSDIIKMGRQHLRDGGTAIYVKQQKTGAEGVIPLTAELIAALAAAPPGNLSFLPTPSGVPLGLSRFRAKFRQWCNQAGLPKDCYAHGLRDTAAVQLAEAGCTPHEIQSMTLHKSLPEVQRYTRGVDQRRVARTARAKTATQIGVPMIGDSKNGS
jgi:integrase